MLFRGSFIGVLFLAIFNLLPASIVKAQMGPEMVKVDTTVIGLSALSTNSLKAKIFSFPYSLLQVKYDSLNNYLFVSGKQGADQLEQGIAKGFFAALDERDRVKWLNESSLNAIDLSCGQLLLSNETRSHRFNKSAGYEETRYTGRLVYTWQKFALGFFYEDNENSTLVCVDLRSGLSKWKANLPGHEDWVDVKFLGDSILLIAAAGLHAIHPIRGLQWSKSFPTSVHTTKAMVYSLAKHSHIEQLSTFIPTSDNENRVGQLSSNIFVDEQRIIFAARGVCVALDLNGKELWRIKMENYPVSKMWLTNSDSALLLINFGLAAHSGRFVSWGRPFILEIYPEEGRIRHEHDLSKIENMADFTKIRSRLIFAGKHEIMDTQHGETEIKTLLKLDEAVYGKFEEFVDGNTYYIFKEGYFVPLNFINDNIVYFRTDHNKIFGLDQELIEYEYHYTELFRYLGNFNGMTLLSNPKKTICISANYELMFELNTGEPLVNAGNRIVFYSENKLTVVNSKDLR